MATYDRTASGPSVLRRYLEGQGPAMEADLTKRLLNYTGRDSRSSAKVEFDPNKIVIHLWIDLSNDPHASPTDAHELASLFLGKNYVIGPHKMVRGMWVAQVALPID